MQKSFQSVVLALSLVLFGCGGSSSEKPTDPDTSKTISITNVVGNGSSSDKFFDALIVTGKNFSSDMQVSLISSARSYTLDYDFNSSTQITASLPQNLAEDDYELSLKTASSSATTYGLKILQGEAGVSILENKIISAYATNICTEFAEQLCYFAGGQYVKLSDGTLILTGGFSMALVDGVSGEIDTDDHSLTMFVAPSMTISWQRLSQWVGRNGQFGSLWLVYERSPETLYLVFDTDFNSTLDETDEVIATLSIGS